MAKEKITSCAEFDETFLQILNKHAPLKSKLLHGNHASYIFKPLRKAIMKKSYLENLYFKKKNRPLLKKLQKAKKATVSDSTIKKEKTFLIS